MASRKTFHRLQVNESVQPGELDGRYQAKHDAHDHKPMKPHELDHLDHNVPRGPENPKAPNPAANLSDRDGMPYCEG